MDYILIRQKRRTVSLQIDSSGELVVKAPNRTSVGFIEKFIESKSPWIEKQRKKMEERNAFKNNFKFSSHLYIFGREYPFAEVDMALIGASEKQIWRYYASLAAQKLPKLAEEMANMTGLEYRGLKLSSSRRAWGTFDRKGNMKLNYKLILLPQELVNYVIIHELCHGVQLNHSKAFWAEVGEFCPNYKAIKKQLELYSFLLTM